MSVLLNLSNQHLFWQGKAPEPISKHHEAACLAWPRDPAEDIQTALDRLAGLVAEAGDDDPLGKVSEVREPLNYQSFWDPSGSRDVIPVAAKRSYSIPEISDALFHRHGFYTAEHDIPYRERALADLGAEKDWWLFDTKGKPNDLSILTYDIETTQWEDGKRDVPVDVIGYADFNVQYEAHKDLETEELGFAFRDLPTDWDLDVTQLTARNMDEELDILQQFTKDVVPKHDVIAGHNVLGFDNKQIHDRMVDFLKRDGKDANLSPGMRDWFQEFTQVYSRPDRSFHFGTSSDIAVWHPVTLDTFHAARKFFFFHDDFTLKGLAPWLGIDVADRVYMDAADMKLDAKTLEYNRHDIHEQVGITQTLVAQALPLAFTVNLPMDELLTGGNTKMWDHMAFLRARRQRRIMPATCRALQVCRTAQRLLPDTPFPTREEVAQAALDLGETEAQGSRYKEFNRIAKQGPEMPFWLEHPSVMADPDPSSSEATGYDIVGGLTLKPDSDLQSHFVPWFHVVEADVGAMYPTILKAKNLTADTVQPARANETPDDWLWLDRLDSRFAESGKYHVRKPTDEESYAQGRGWMIGIKKSPDDGMVNLAMTGILDTIQKVKDARAAAKAAGDDTRIHDMTYASLKAARNAGTHGIMVAVNVSCRQFNMWGGAAITTIGQKVLHETREGFEKRGRRVVYGDTDGIYLACSKSAGNLPHMAAALNADVEPREDAWITLPDDAMEAIDAMNTHWREFLNYPGFELEAEVSDAMVFVVHKNYLKFSAKDGKLKMETKGNNFKGSDKAPLARTLLSDIMAIALREVADWDDEEDARERMKAAIKRATAEVMKDRDVTDTEWDELTLRQQVRPIKSYKPNPDGSASSFAVRSAAIEHLLEEQLTASRKMKFIVCKDPLPLYSHPQAQTWAKDRLGRQGLTFTPRKPNKSGIKPVEYMWPIDRVEPHMIDWTWYKDTVENYVKGAFGFNSLELATQRDLSSWF